MQREKEERYVDGNVEDSQKRQIFSYNSSFSDLDPDVNVGETNADGFGRKVGG